MTPFASFPLDRRHFLKAGTAAAASFAGLAPVAARPFAPKADRCIFINLVGGPSQIDTFDPKPNAPADVRGPFRPIRTSVPGIFVSELLPRLAERMDQIALLRSVFHEEAPIHETGLQLVQTGSVAEPGCELPHVGQLANSGRFIIVPGPIESTGVSISHGQPESQSGGLPRLSASNRYGNSSLGHSLRLAKILVEQQPSFVVVNAATTVFNELTWDCHADGGALGTTLEDLRTTVAPAFDQALATLLDDLTWSGLLERTLVVATGEFGRTPRINRRGGRDHWPSVWTALFAGGGVRGGQVIGASDARGAGPKDRPIPAAAIPATVLMALGTTTTHQHEAVWELF